MLCQNNQNEAAAHFIRRLADPDRRADALRTVQRTIEPRYDLPFVAELDRRQAAVATRKDVRDAIDKVGRILDLPYFGLYWGDY